MAQLFYNNAYATLATAITDADTTIEVSGATNFPASLSGGDYFLLTLYADTSRYGDNIEVVKVTGVSLPNLTVERGYEFAATSHDAGEKVEARLTADTLTRISEPMQTVAPTLASASVTVNEGDTATIAITNHDPTLHYSTQSSNSGTATATVSGGDLVIDTTLVDSDTSVTISVNAKTPGIPVSDWTDIAVTVAQVPDTADTSIQVVDFTGEAGTNDGWDLV